MNPVYDICKFCYSNGEAEAQYRSHALKNSSGLVTCPVLGSFVCPICQATGGFAHTQRYCPLNIDGQFNSGASLTELKKKKNAAGNFPSSKKTVWPIPSPHHKVFTSYNGTNKFFWSPAAFEKFDHSPNYKITTNSSLHPVTDPLPPCYHSPSPPTNLLAQPPSAQFALDRHMEYVDYYQNKQLHHQGEITKLQAIRQAARVASTHCYMRNFPSPISVTPPGSPQDKFIFPEKKGADHGRGLLGRQEGAEQEMWVEDKVKQMDVANDDLGKMLAELREGTEEVDI